MVCFAQMIGQDVCVSCTYAVLLGAKSTQNRRGNVRESSACFPGPLCAMSDGNTAALAGKAPDPAAGNKKPLPSGRGGSRQADGEGVGADSISARARLPPPRELSAQLTEGVPTAKPGNAPRPGAPPDGPPARGRRFPQGRRKVP